MDPVTHTLIGANLAQAFFKRRIGPETIPILALASNLPDIDTLVLLTGNPLSITLRRSFGHSLFTLPLLSAALAWGLKRHYPRQNWTNLFWLSLLGAAVHVFFDLVNSFGVLLLWPFFPWRPELAIIFIIDLVLIGFLAAPFLICWARRRRARLEMACRLTLACVALYVLFCAASRLRAQRLLARESAASGAEFSYIFPEPLGAHRWRGVLRRGNAYRVYLVHSLSGKMEAKGSVATAIGEPEVEEARHSPQGRRLEAFFKAPVWRFDSAGKSPHVSVYDLRFKPLTINRGRAFEFRFPSD